jgi:hypothetical protein
MDFTEMLFHGIAAGTICGLYLLVAVHLWTANYESPTPEAPIIPDIPGIPDIVPPESTNSSITMIRRFTGNTVTDPKRGTENPNTERVDAILDYISNLDAVKHLRIDTRCSVANGEDITLTPEITARIKETATNDTDATVHLTLTSPSLRISQIRAWIDEVHEQYMFEKTNRFGNKIYYFNEIPVAPPKMLDPNTKQETYRFEQAPKTLVFTMNEFHTTKSFTNVYGDHVSELCDRLELFMKHPEWYAARGIPHSLGILLHGIPGAGKTSTIKAIARDTNRHIFNLSLRSFTTQKQLTTLFYNETVAVTGVDGQPQTYRIPLNRRLYVIEDIDCLSDVVLDRQVFPRSEPASGELLTLSFLLNLLDGVLETPGRILVITTNYPDRLDPALIRPGRIDVRIDFGKATREMILEMVNHFYASDFTLDVIPQELHHILTPAEVMECLCAHFRDSAAAIQHLVAKARAPRDRVAAMIGSTPILAENDDVGIVDLAFDTPMELTIEEVTEHAPEITESIRDTNQFPPEELVTELEAPDTTTDRIEEIIKARRNDLAEIQQYREAPPSLEALQKEIEEAPNSGKLLHGYMNHLDNLQVDYCDEGGLAPY